MMHQVGILSLLTISVAAPAGSSAWNGAAGLLSRLADQPADALINQTQPDPESTSTTELITTDPATGLAVRQRHRWVADPGVLVIESELTNPGKTTATAGPVHVARWAFRIADGEDGTRYRKLTYRNDVWYGSTYWTGPNWTRVGQDWHHPGVDTPSVRRFTVPRDGRVMVTGRVYKADTNKGGGDGVRLSIRHGTRTIWKAEIDGDDAKGTEPRLTLDVRKGDAIRFVVHKRGRITCDTTRWDPVVVYAEGGERFQASKGFSTSRQGEGGWSYEMEIDPNVKTRLPAVHGFGLDLALLDETPIVAAPVALTSRDALPLFALSDGPDQSGVVLALAPTAPWRLHVDLTKGGLLRVHLIVGAEKAGQTLRPGESILLPQVALGAYQGQWLQGIATLQRLVGPGRAPSSPAEAALQGKLRAHLSAVFDQTAAPQELDFWTMIQADWRRQDQSPRTKDDYAAAAQRQLEQTQALLADLQADQATGFLAAEAQQLEQLAALAGQDGGDVKDPRSLYLRVRRLKRRIALANPLMRFGPMLFLKRVPTSYSHLVMQYFGWRARAGGGIFVLERPGESLVARDLLGGRLDDGSVLEPRLSYDAKRIVFSFVRCAGRKYDYRTLDNKTDEGFYHIYEVNADGTGLRQLTRGPYDDVMPTYLPDGGIAFCSTRRRGYARCFGGQFSRRWHAYTLHRMDADGGDLRTLSFNDVNEWFPTVSNAGRILYARWDYIDRDAVTHQNLWATRPDGTNPVAVWGNATPSPHCTFQMQPIPRSNKIVFTASAHHSVTGGAIAIVDPDVDVDGEAALTRITPKIPFPESESRKIEEYYAAPWPLSERYFLVAYSPKPLVWEPGANPRDALGIYLLDAAGNRELIYRDPDIGSTNPCPLRPRPTPPIVPSHLPAETPETGEMVLLDVYEGLGNVPRGSIRQLRIVQIFPKATPVANTPPIGMAREENGRAVLGIVPVESDGSARFVVPARKALLFQVLDKDGFAVRTMRSLTYVQPGERVSCIGCHERRTTAPGQAVALQRGPSTITPGPFEGQPFSYVRVVQPVLDRHCVRCHDGQPSQRGKKGVDLTGKPHKGFTRSYCSLCGDRTFTGAGTNPKNAAEALVPRYGARNQIQMTPVGGQYGALGSRLVKMLRKGHQGVRLSAKELRRLALWIDCNAIFYGVHLPEEQARQLRGEVLAMPTVQ